MEDKREVLDFHVRAFGRLLATLPDHLPISEAYSDGDYSGVWYNSQREHMESWFNTQATKGKGQYIPVKLQTVQRRQHITDYFAIKRCCGSTRRSGKRLPRSRRLRMPQSKRRIIVAGAQ